MHGVAIRRRLHFTPPGLPHWRQGCGTGVLAAGTLRGCSAVLAQVLATWGSVGLSLIVSPCSSLSVSLCLSHSLSICSVCLSLFLSPSLSLLKLRPLCLRIFLSILPSCVSIFSSLVSHSMSHFLQSLLLCVSLHLCTTFHVQISPFG